MNICACGCGGAMTTIEATAAVLKGTRKLVRPRLSQGKLARILGRHRNWVSMVERGDAIPDALEIMQWGDAVGIDGWKLLKKITKYSSHECVQVAHIACTERASRTTLAM